MAIARVNIPTPTAPVGVADYQAQLDQITALNQAFTGRNPVDGSTIRAGTVMMVGSVLYKATSDTPITGTPSLYVKITPSGASATASFVANLTGVSWNHTYGGYYDGTGNLYLFDEALAYATGVIGSYYTMGSRLIHGNQIIADSIPVSKMAVNAKFSSSHGGSVTGAITLPSISIGETRVAWYDVGNGLNHSFVLPAAGTYSADVLYSSGTGGDSGGTFASGKKNASGGSTIVAFTGSFPVTLPCAKVTYTRLT